MNRTYKQEEPSVGQQKQYMSIHENGNKIKKLNGYIHYKYLSPYHGKVGKSKTPQIKSMSTMPTRTKIQNIQLSNSNINNLNNKSLREKQQVVRYNPLSIGTHSSQSNRLRIGLNNESQLQNNQKVHINKNNKGIYENSKSMAVGNKLLINLDNKSRTKNSQKQYSGNGPHLLAPQLVNKSWLQKQNFELRSKILDLQLKQRDYIDKINELQKLCIKLNNCMEKKILVTKRQKKYLQVVQRTFQHCFGISNFKDIWHKQKQILQQWMGMKTKSKLSNNQKLIKQVYRNKNKHSNDQLNPKKVLKINKVRQISQNPQIQQDQQQSQQIKEIFRKFNIRQQNEKQFIKRLKQPKPGPKKIMIKKYDNSISSVSLSELQQSISQNIQNCQACKKQSYSSLNNNR